MFGQGYYLDGDAEHEAEEELVLLEEAAADVAVQGVGDILHQGAYPGSQHIRGRRLHSFIHFTRSFRPILTI